MTEGLRPIAARRARIQASFLLAVGIASLALIVFLIGLVTGIRGIDLVILATALVTLVVACIPVMIDRARAPESRQLFITFFGLVYPVYFVIPLFTEYLWTEADVMRGGIARLRNIAPADILTGQLAALVGLIVLLVGFATPIGRAACSVIPQPRREWFHEPALMVAIVMIPTGWIVFMGGQLGLVPGRLGSGVLGAIASSIYFGFALLTAIYHRYKSRQAVLLMWLLLPPTMAICFFTGSKKLFLAPLAMVALAHIAITRRVRVSWLAGGAAAIVLIYPVAQFYREVVQRGSTFTMRQVLSDPAGAVSALSAFASQVDSGEYLAAGAQATASRFNALGILCVILRDTPGRVPFQNGRTLSYIVISYVPRIIWPGKPITTIGQWVTESYSAQAGSTSSTGPSWIGELYFNFGWPGIVGGMFLIGIYFRILQEMLFAANAPIPATVASVIVFWTTLTNLQAAVIAPINGVPFLVFPLVVAHVTLRVIGGTYLPSPEIAEDGPRPDSSSVPRYSM